MTSKTFYSPLSQRVRPFMVMSQARVAKADAKLSIMRRFMLGSTHWLLVQNPQDQSTLEVSVDWLSRRYEGVFAALLPAYMNYDPSNGAVEHTVVEVIDRAQVRILGENEIEALLPHIQAEIVGRRIWTEGMQRNTLFGDIENSFGPFSDETSENESDASVITTASTNVPVSAPPVVSDGSGDSSDSVKLPRKRRFF